jgi:hypothetical protein
MLVGTMLLSKQAQYMPSLWVVLKSEVGEQVGSSKLALHYFQQWPASKESTKHAIHPPCGLFFETRSWKRDGALTAIQVGLNYFQPQPIGLYG